MGEKRIGKLIYLALTSRVLHRPTSVGVKGPSSAGKSWAVQRVLDFLPPSAYYAVTAMSEKLLIYTEADFKHRFIVITEAAGLNSDFQSYLLRSLLSEGRLLYETLEKTASGIKPRRIEKEGPTGLLVTTTALHMHPENETRMLSLTVSDTKEQTKRVFRALAATGPSSEIPAEWHALQTWLSHGAHDVDVPYAEALAELVPPLAVRLRRDFGAVLNLIRAHAILHQASRRIVNGRVVATLGDYAAVRALVADIVSEGVSAQVSKPVAQTVEAVEALVKKHPRAETFNLAQLASVLQLDKSSVSRRVSAAIDAGYLVNREDKDGKPAKIALGEPMPDDQSILPESDELRRSAETTPTRKAPLRRCAVAGGDARPPSPLRPRLQ